MSGSAFKESIKDYDWLGKGTYFWEGDALRAHDWATKRRYQDPSVVGAVIDLGHCLDLTIQDGVRVVKRAYENFERLQTTRGRPLPENTDPPKDRSGDFVLRRLDRAVIDHLNICKTEHVSAVARPLTRSVRSFQKGNLSIQTPASES